jgi:hypothetical protein
VILRARGDDRAALAKAREAIEARNVIGPSHESVKLAFVEGGEAASTLGDPATIEEFATIIENLGRRRTGLLLTALAHRFRGRLASLDGDAGTASMRYDTAESELRQADLPFWLGGALLEHAVWLASEGQESEAKPLLQQAREIFDRLGAKPWLERVDRAIAGEPDVSAVASS